MSETSPFPIEAGDTVTFITNTGFQSGYFVRWNKHGSAVLKKPAGGHANIVPRLLRPCNDGRMVKKRGFIEWPKPDGLSTLRATKKKEKK